MDTLEFLRERKRMCLLHKACGGCPLAGTSCSPISSTSDEDFEKIIAIVEKWSKEHPRKTRQSAFLKMFPNADVDATGVLFISPCKIDKTLHGPLCKPSCDGCRREFWMQEVE